MFPISSVEALFSYCNWKNNTTADTAAPKKLSSDKSAQSQLAPLPIPNSQPAAHSFGRFSPSKLVLANHHTERINSVPPQKVKDKFIKKLCGNSDEGSLVSKSFHSLCCHFLFMNIAGGVTAPGKFGW